MSTLTDTELALLWLRRITVEPGPFTAPAAVGEWTGRQLRLHPTGTPLAAEAAALAPGLAEALQARSSVPATPVHEPRIADLEHAWPAGLIAPLVSREAFTARLTACRACPLWSESAREGRGRCDSVRCRCSRRLLWLPAESCPEGRWNC